VRAPPRATRLAGIAGIIGPLWLGGTIAALSAIDYDFMRSLGWHPLDAPGVDWPSGLALGPHGAWLTAAFLGCGALLMPFVITLHRTLRPTPRGGYGPALLGTAGVALALLAAPTDPTLAGGPRTWHGLLHDGAFVLLGLTLLPGMLLLGARMRHDPAWRGHTAYTWGTLLLAAPAFALKGAAFYLFLLAAMAWFIVTGIRLMRQDGFEGGQSPP
jgi:hypothetical protein